jgi:hypothetical protein
MYPGRVTCAAQGRVLEPLTWLLCANPTYRVSPSTHFTIMSNVLSQVALVTLEVFTRMNAYVVVGGLLVSVLAIGIKVREFKPSRRR